MLIGIFSDLHAHPFKPYATILADGMNSRLADAVSCVNQIRDICVTRGVEMVLFGGDMFHTRGRLAVQAFNAVYEAIAGFRVHKIPIAMIHGNHDQADREGSVYSIHTLRTVAEIVDKPSWNLLTGSSGRDLAVLAAPYTENIEHLHDIVQTPMPYTSPKRIPRIFLGHFGITGARVGSDFVYTNPHDATVADLNQDAFDAGFLGHFHLHQKVGKNFVFIGAPLQHNWGDRDDPGRGFLIYDTDTRITERVPLKSPEFRLLTTLDKKATEHKDCYVRLTSDRAWSEDEKEEWRTSIGARAFEIVPADVVTQKPTQTRLNVGPSASYKDMVERYVSSGLQPTEGLDPEYLMQLGLELLEEATGDAD